DCAGGAGIDKIVFDPVVFPPGALTVATITGGELVVKDVLSDATYIDGGGAVAIDADRVSRVLYAHTPTYLAGVTIRNGYLQNGNGAGIYDAGALSLDHVTVSGNKTGAGNGGGIFSKAALSLVHSTVSGNTANGVIVAGMQSGSGGGIYALGPFNLTDSVVSGNSAMGNGGGIFQGSSNTSAPLFYVNHSSITGN